MFPRVVSFFRVFILVAFLAGFIPSSTAGQRTFVPNGRYGRRADIPPIVGVQSLQNAGADSETPSTLLLNEKVISNPMYVCTHIGVADYYRCGRRSASAFIGEEGSR
ncbi:uncharacterized protein LOC100909169 [Galendromus occidentalis]|uniref:Uncharacterized protein LOC100909169 n=1 Tax=Galendromus occidentalis TaxID=34638 RepID=A0AAJ6QVR6_9ACAR|nr:uncharacterized protein LOC100909169 [Galendromus occidentalis]